ncbi:MAG TPA: hypothetical protein VIO14_08480 [Dehalococcoidia bacterium]
MATNPEQAPDVAAAVKGLAVALENRDLATLMAALTPEAMAKVMTLQGQLGGSGQAGDLESFELTPAGTREGDPLYRLALRGAGREVVLETRWRLVEGRWRVADLNVVE